MKQAKPILIILKGEFLMELDRLNKRLELLEKVTVTGRRITKLHHVMNIREIWYEAYANIYSNKGAMTEGIDEDTLDGMSHKRIDKIIKNLREETYTCKPVRRVYIPKRNGELRPLGIPSGTGKMVQGVCKTILERIYEPIFSDYSHGFRPSKSCHTALEQVKKLWTGTKWFIELDIKGFFDNMSHKIMIGLLEKKIDDTRFIKTIKGMLKAGYLEDWIYHNTYSGVPQGGIISPILSNIYLHELDDYVVRLMGEFNKGRKRPINPEYQRLDNAKVRLRRKMRQQGKTPELEKQLQEADKLQKRTPSGDTFSKDYKRLRFCRYADDFIIGVIGSKKEAEHIQKKVVDFLSDKLKLQIAEGKTCIVSGHKGTQFLSYTVSIWRTSKTLKKKIKGTYTTQRTVMDGISLRVLPERVIKFNEKHRYGNWEESKPVHRAELYNGSDEEIILTYNSELRGLANYYALAYDVKGKLSQLEYMANYSLFKTLAGKHKSKLTTILKRLKKNSEYIHRYALLGKPKEIKVFQLKHMEKHIDREEGVDETPNTLHLTASKSELIRRMEADTCEYCGKETPNCEVHHVQKLKDLQRKPKLELWEKVMIARSRKTLVLCAGTKDSCHELLHAGKLPDNRYKSK